MEQLEFDKPVVFFDLETTGISAPHDRIVEFSGIKLYPDGHRDTKSMRMNPNMPIPKSATDVHGITNADVAGLPTFAYYAVELAEFFGDADLFKDGGDGFEALFTCHLGEAGVHGGKLFFFPCGGGFEVFKGGADDACGEVPFHLDFAAFEEFEETLGVFLLLAGGLFEDSCDLDVALFFGLSGKVGVAVSSLGFSCESGEEVLFRLGSFK